MCGARLRAALPRCRMTHVSATLCLSQRLSLFRAHCINQALPMRFSGHGVTFRRSWARRTFCISYITAFVTAVAATARISEPRADFTSVDAALNFASKGHAAKQIAPAGDRWDPHPSVKSKGVAPRHTLQQHCFNYLLASPPASPRLPGDAYRYPWLLHLACRR